MACNAVSCFFRRLATLVAILLLLVASLAPDTKCSFADSDGDACAASAPHLADGHHRRGAALLQRLHHDDEGHRLIHTSFSGSASSANSWDSSTTANALSTPGAATSTPSFRRDGRRRSLPPPLSLLVLRHKHTQSSGQASLERARLSSTFGSDLALSSALDAMGQSSNSSTDELENLILKFIDQQEASKEKCSAQLLKAKHELNQLHAHIQSLAELINVTNLGIQVVYEQLVAARELVEQVDEWRTSQLQQCNVTKMADLVMYQTLKAELNELHQVASYSASVNWSAPSLSQTESRNNSSSVSVNWSAPSLSQTESRSNSSSVSANWSAPSLSQTKSRINSPLVSTTWSAPSFSQTESRNNSSSVPANWSALSLSQTESRNISSSVSANWSAPSLSQTVSRNNSSSVSANSSAPSLSQSNIRNSSSWIYACANGSFECTGNVEWCAARKRTCHQNSTTRVSSFSALSLLQLQEEFAPRGGSGAMDAATKTASGVAAVWGEAGLGEVLTLVRETHDVASELATCMTNSSAAQNVAPERAVLLQRGRKEMQSSRALQLSRSALLCNTSSKVRITVGNNTLELSPAHALAGNGSMSALYCSEVNTAYIGSIWLVCNNGKLTATNGDCVLSPKTTASECSQLESNLRRVYAKSYVQLARLVSSYQVMSTSSACESLAHVEYTSRKEHAVSRSERLLTEMHAKVTTLHDTLQPQLDEAQTVEIQLRSHVASLMQECEALPATLSNLDKVREAIHALKLCVGEVKTKLRIPRWTGTYASMDVDLYKDSNDVIDARINTLCSGTTNEGFRIRAAETSEIELQAIENMPENNTAGDDLMGACPHCEGDTDDTYVSKHARVCWRKRQPLNTVGRSMNCSSGSYSLLCVAEIEVADPL